MPPVRLPLSWLAAAAVTLSTALPAQAIVTTTPFAQWAGSGDARLGGVAYLSIAGVGACSGSLLEGGAWVLTAAHCVTNGSGALSMSSATVSFGNSGVTARVSSAAQAFVLPGWTGAGANGEGLGLNNDLALLRLDTPVTAVAGYHLFTGDALGQSVLLAGYGRTGTGATGYGSGFGALYYGYNQYEQRWTPGNSMLFDFDNGLAAQNLFGSLGLGNSEASIAPGDSGGPSFVQVNGQLWLAGVHSFIGNEELGPGDIDAALNASFGEFAGDSTLDNPAALSWLATVANVPEPPAWALLLLGGLLTHRLGRRRRA